MFGRSERTIRNWVKAGHLQRGGFGKANTGGSIQHRGDARHRPQQADHGREGRADPFSVAVGRPVGSGAGADCRAGSALALLEKPPTTPDNSTAAATKDQKTTQPPDDCKPQRKSRPGFGRTLEPNPDRIFDPRLDACPRCAAACPASRPSTFEVAQIAANLSNT